MKARQKKTQKDQWDEFHAKLAKRVKELANDPKFIDQLDAEVAGLDDKQMAEYVKNIKKISTDESKDMQTKKWIEWGMDQFENGK